MKKISTDTNLNFFKKMNSLSLYIGKNLLKINFFQKTLKFYEFIKKKNSKTSIFYEFYNL
ncbi:MAG: hypothetical protein B6I24_06300 [Bacteroidetes bacterium 4572_128]|nr:MAG: hypothetical protein B6I24_06300 [Bacteroidetes bacterium 4572_128]